MRILIGGSLKDVPREAGLCQQFAVALGSEVVKRGHTLLNGCRGSLDEAVATAAAEWLTANGKDPAKFIIGYCANNCEPAHNIGKIRRSALVDWQMNHPELRVPEQIELADATVFGGGTGI